MGYEVSDRELLYAFEQLCQVYGVESAGFDRMAITAPIDGDKHDGKTRWAMHFSPDYGWMIVGGWHGLGSMFTGAGGYTKCKWDFFVLIEALATAALKM